MRKVVLVALLISSAAFAYNTTLGNRGTYGVYSGKCEDMGMLTLNLNAFGTMINIDTIIGTDTLQAQLTEVLPYVALSFTPWHYLEFGLWGHGRYGSIGGYTSATSELYQDLGLSVKGGVPIYFNEAKNLYFAPGISGFAYMEGLGSATSSYGFGGCGLLTFNAAFFGFHLNGGYEYITGAPAAGNVLTGVGLEFWPFKFAGLVVDGTARIPSNDFAGFMNYLKVTPGIRLGFGGRVFKFNLNLGAELELMQTPFRWRGLAGVGLGFDLMPPSEATVEGIVVDKETQKPVVGAKVYVEGHPDIEPYVTGEDGRFSVNVPEGEYSLIAEHPDYIRTSTSGELIAMESGKIVLELPKVASGATLVGVVSDASNEKPVSAVLNFVSISSDTILSSFKSDGVSGYYRAVVPPGTYRIDVSASGYRKTHKSVMLKEADEIVVDFKLEPAAPAEKKALVFAPVFFGRGVTEPSTKCYETLQDAVSVLKANPDVKVELQGNTDSIGDAKSNYKISLKRAESVRNYMIQSGISADRIRVVGYGESRPRGDNRTNYGRDLNRRVDIIAL